MEAFADIRLRAWQMQMHLYLWNNSIPIFQYEIENRIKGRKIERRIEKTVRAVQGMEQYDESVKQVLAHKIILASILVHYFTGTCKNLPPYTEKKINCTGCWGIIYK